MQILMLGNSFTSANDLPELLAQRTGAQVTAHTRGGARLSEQLNPRTKMGARTRTALQTRYWDAVVMQEMSNGPITAQERFFASVSQLSDAIRQSGAVPVLFASWAYQDPERLAAIGLDQETMFLQMSDACQRAAEQNGCLLADVGQAFAAFPDRPLLYAPDGVHPSPAGSQLAADVLAHVILEACRKSSAG